MRCPKCKEEGCKYKIQRNVNIKKKLKKSAIKAWKKKSHRQQDKLPPRTDFNAICNKCGWEGKI